MKKTILLLCFFAFAAVSGYSQRTTVTGHCYATLVVVDNSYTSGDYYDIYLRMETTDPWTSSYVWVDRIYSPTTYYPSNVQVSNVPYNPPVSPGYYSMRIAVVKNLSSSRNNSSTATPSVINDFNVRFDADYTITVTM